MQGRRVHLNEKGELWLAEGEYGKDKNGRWFGRPPGSTSGDFSQHEVTEHEDGTITVSPSILISTLQGEVLWHGYLERGVWRQV